MGLLQTSYAMAFRTPSGAREDGLVHPDGTEEIRDPSVMMPTVCRCLSCSCMLTDRQSGVPRRRAHFRRLSSRKEGLRSFGGHTACTYDE
jgi:hypothetical protein